MRPIRAMMADADSVQTEARRALQMLLSGDEAGGLALYQECLATLTAPKLPVGLHLLLLEKNGKSAAADRLRRLALRNGGNIAHEGVAVAAPAEAAIAEYERLIASGLVNVRMIEAYLMLLSRSGGSGRIAEICDPERLLVVENLALRGVHGGGSLAEEVQHALLREETNATEVEAAQSVRHQRKLNHVEALPDPAGAALAAALHERAARHLAGWAASDHPLAHVVPNRVAIESWALISRGSGHTVPHIHHRGWITGVYYPGGLDPEERGGLLSIGPPRAVEQAEGWPRAEVRPAAGLLVLMPSYYTHWSEPLARPGLRIAVAFDAVAADECQSPH